MTTYSFWHRDKEERRVQEPFRMTATLPAIQPAALFSPVMWFNILANAVMVYRIARDPHSIYAWCGFGAVVAATAVINHARRKQRDWWLYLTISLLCLTAGVAGPQSFLYDMDVKGYEYWPPVSFLWLGFGFAFLAFPLSVGLYKVLLDIVPQALVKLAVRFGVIDPPQK